MVRKLRAWYYKRMLKCSSSGHSSRKRLHRANVSAVLWNGLDHQRLTASRHSQTFVIVFALAGSWIFLSDMMCPKDTWAMDKPEMQHGLPELESAFSVDLLRILVRAILWVKVTLSSINFVEEVDKLLKVYLVVRFKPRQFDHRLELFIGERLAHYFKNFFQVVLTYIALPVGKKASVRFKNDSVVIHLLLSINHRKGED